MQGIARAWIGMLGSALLCRMVRSWIVRRSLAAQCAAAVRIQAALRGYIIRNRCFQNAKGSTALLHCLCLTTHLARLVAVRLVHLQERQVQAWLK